MFFVVEDVFFDVLCIGEDGEFCVGYVGFLVIVGVY